MTLLSFCLPARATASVLLQVNAETHRGYISAAITASGDLPEIALYEMVDGTLQEVVRPNAHYVAESIYGPVYWAPLPDVLRWSCTQRTRRLVAIASNEQRAEQTDYVVRTPSCANRLALSARPRKVTVRDTWELGDVTAQVCGPRRCSGFELSAGQTKLTRRMRLRRGDRVSLYADHQETTQTVGAKATGSTLLITGDSLMQSLDSVLEDRLARRAAVVSDVKPGAALSANFVVDWPALARKQVRRHRPHATILFLGTNDSFTMRAPDGRDVECCGPDWAQLYEIRARQVMEIYAQDGAGRVIWLTVPYARDERRWPPATAINGAIARAAASVPGARLIPADEIFTPGRRYRETMTYRGRLRDVREDDGIHLSLPGARIAADHVIAALKRARLIGR